MAAIWQRAHGYSRGGGTLVAQDRPLMRQLSDGGLRLELSSADAVWIIHLSLEDCRQIADEIGRPPPGAWPHGGDE